MLWSRAEYRIGTVVAPTNYHLAQINIARMIASLTDERMAGFVTQLDRINQLADDSPGFVWRLQTEEGDATSLRVFDDPMLLVNLSLWESFEALKAYVYSSEHRNLLRDRKLWFGRLPGAHLALWWVPAGTVPSLDDAKARLRLVDDDGPGPQAFTFSSAYPPPGHIASTEDGGY